MEHYSIAALVFDVSLMVFGFGWFALVIQRWLHNNGTDHGISLSVGCIAGLLIMLVLGGVTLYLGLASILVPFAILSCVVFLYRTIDALDTGARGEWISPMLGALMITGALVLYIYVA